MTVNVTINPVNTTNAAGSFGTDWGGYIQGMVLNDPAVRYQLAGGTLASTETLPMWGGVGVYEDMPSPTTGPIPSLGSIIGRATAITGSATNLAGFSTFEQASAMISSPQSPVPLSGTGMIVNFYRFGTNARILLNCNPLLASLESGAVGAQVSWDFLNQQLIPYVAAYAADTITAATWASTGGGTATITLTTGGELAVGDVFTISGVTPAAYNGTFTAIAGTTGTTLKYLLPLATTPGAGSAFGQLNAGGGAVPCRAILRIEPSNSMTVVYNATTGFATWNRAGTVAQVLL